MQLIMQNITVTMISAELHHRTQFKPVVSWTAFGKPASIWNPVWSGLYVPHPDPTRTDGQPMQSLHVYIADVALLHNDCT
jgi:hypothetical protein